MLTFNFPLQCFTQLTLLYDIHYSYIWLKTVNILLMIDVYPISILSQQGIIEVNASLLDSPQGMMRVIDCPIARWITENSKNGTIIVNDCPMVRQPTKKSESGTFTINDCPIAGIRIYRRIFQKVYEIYPVKMQVTVVDCFTMRYLCLSKYLPPPPPHAHAT